MKYYQTDPDTGELLSGPIEAEEDRNAKGHFFIPRGGITRKPMVPPAGYRAVWRADDWVAVEDHRGKTGYVDGVPTLITELGELPDNWVTELPEPPEPPVQAITARQVRLGLLKLDITEDLVKQHLTAPEALIEWEYASYIEKDHPLVQALAVIFNIDTETFFETASKL